MLRRFAHQHRSVHQPVLGTVLDLQLRTISARAARRAEAAVLAEFDRLLGVLSAFNPESELCRWRRAPEGPFDALSPEFRALLHRTVEWQERSDGVFNPAVGELALLWKHAEKAQEIPSRAQVQAAADGIHVPRFTIDDGRVVATGDCSSLTFHAIAKGMAVDIATSVGVRSPGVGRIVVNLGGDLRHCGSGDLVVGIEDPERPHDNAAPLTAVRVSNGGLATSGPVRRGVRIAGTWFSHVIDPRTGWPVDHVRSASVVGPDACTADVVATVLSVLPPAASLPWLEDVNQRADQRLGSLVVDDCAVLHRNDHWSSLEVAPTGPLSVRPTT